MKFFSWLPAAIAAAVLPACDGINLKELKPGVATVADVRQRMGPPSAEFSNEDGTLTYEYNRQPNGVDCFMLTFGPDLILQRSEQVLTEAQFAKISAGLNREQVRRLLGKPGQVNVYRNSGEEVWDWRFAGGLPTEEWHFHVHFDQQSGLVKRTSRRLEQKG